MATGEQTTLNELSLDLSLLCEDVNRSVEDSHVSSNSSSEQEDLEELVIPDDSFSSKHAQSTRLDLSGLSGSSTDSNGPSLTRDRTSTLPSVHQRPFLAGEAWGDSDTESEERSRRNMKDQEQKQGDNSRRNNSIESVVERVRSRERSLNAERFPIVPVNTPASKGSPTRLPSFGVAFGSGFAKNSNFQSTRLFSRARDEPRALPPFLKAHTREQRLKALPGGTDEEQKVVEETKDAGKPEMPKDFATLHLLARRSKGHLRYRYMAMLSQWIKEKGVPTT